MKPYSLQSEPYDYIPGLIDLIAGSVLIILILSLLLLICCSGSTL